MKDFDYEKTGYLTAPFKLFHLRDCEDRCYDFHYHDFHKILLFLSGDVNYFIEGTSYRLEANDIVLVNAGEVHRPVIRSGIPYERMILYVSPEFLTSLQGISGQEKDSSMEVCFIKAKTEQLHVLRSSSASIHKLFQLCRKLENSLSGTEYGARLYSHALFLEFLVLLNRSFLTDPISYIETSLSNQKILDVLHYINDNLNSDLSIDTLSQRFFISRRYLMQLFQQETGYSIGKYVNAKRLFSARDKIQHGFSLTEACFSSGFQHYSTFTRSYYRMFHTTPGSLKKEL